MIEFYLRSLKCKLDPRTKYNKLIATLVVSIFIIRLIETGFNLMLVPSFIVGALLIYVIFALVTDAVFYHDCCMLCKLYKKVK